jgi:hypothetical protein
MEALNASGGAMIRERRSAIGQRITKNIESCLNQAAEKRAGSGKSEPIATGEDAGRRSRLCHQNKPHLAHLQNVKPRQFRRFLFIRDFCEASEFILPQK